MKAELDEFGFHGDARDAEPPGGFGLITARSNQLSTALGAGAGALLEKPLDFPKLLQTISRLLTEPAEFRLARMAGYPADSQSAPALLNEQ
jgi:hypothetical protein